jgi:hypothetical protein
MYNAKEYECNETSEKEDTKYSLIYDKSYYGTRKNEDVLAIKTSYIPTETLFFE